MVSPDVAFQARYPGAAGPEPTPETGGERVQHEAFCLYLTPMPTVSFVEDVRLGDRAVADVVEQVRALLRERGRSQAAWVVSDQDPDLRTALTAHGLEPYTDPPLGPTSTAMALLQPPAGGAGDAVVVREAASLEDFEAAGHLAADVFGMADADRAGMLATMVQRHALHLEGRAPLRSYLAFVDGVLVGEAQSRETRFGTNLAGSCVHPSARGRGVYRALVAARWEQAVERGVPVLTVQAGDMSRPVLQKLGFEVVDEMVLLRDRC